MTTLARPRVLKVRDDAALIARGVRRQLGDLFAISGALLAFGAILAAFTVLTRGEDRGIRTFRETVTGRSMKGGRK